jgi:hypothetical protein
MIQVVFVKLLGQGRAVVSFVVSKVAIEYFIINILVIIVYYKNLEMI